MDYTRALTFIFKEQNWIKKILIPGVITLIPVAGILHLIGWATEITNREIYNEPEKLPESASWQYLIRGIKLLITSFVYYIPMILIWAILQFFSWFWALIFNGNLESFGVQIFHFLSDACNFVYFFFFLFILPAIILNFLRTERIRDTFEFQKVYLLIKNNKQTFLTLFIALAVSIVIASLGVSIFYIGIIFTIPYGTAVFANLLGQTERII